MQSRYEGRKNRLGCRQNGSEKCNRAGSGKGGEVLADRAQIRVAGRNTGLVIPHRLARYSKDYAQPFASVGTESLLRKRGTTDSKKTMEMADDHRGAWRSGLSHVIPLYCSPCLSPWLTPCSSLTPSHLERLPSRGPGTLNGKKSTQALGSSAWSPERQNPLGAAPVHPAHPCRFLSEPLSQ